MKSKKKKKARKLDADLKRKFPKAFVLNARELKVFKDYCKKYHIQNQSQFMREAIITTILKQLNDDAPTLFDTVLIEKNIAVNEPKTTYENPQKIEKNKPEKPKVVMPDLFSGLM
jgi:hypothetical protein